MNKVVWISFAVLLILLILNNGYYNHYKSQPPKSKPIQSLTSATPPSFRDETLKWQLNAKHHQSGKKLTGLNEILGSGACVIDFNNDGWEDIFVVGGSGQHRFYGDHSWWAKSEGNTLWENTGSESFINVSKNSNIPFTDWGMGCAVGDLDNDGDQDLLILNIGKNTLLENMGNGTFTDISNKSGINKNSNWSLSASMADYNGDGLLDIYISNFIDYKKDIKLFERSSGYLKPTDAFFNARLYNSQSNNLYKNTGNMQFVDKANELNVANSTGRGKAVHWLDINADHLPDLIVLNSGGSPNQLYINKGNEKGFITNTSVNHIESPVGSQSVAVGDIDNDNDIDMIFSRPSGTPPMLLINNDDKGFDDHAWNKGLAINDYLFQDSWGTILNDFNNDGWLDIYMTNGLAMVDPDSHRTTIVQKDSLWINQNGQFTPSSLNHQFKTSGRGIVSADFNNDGLMDLLITENNDYARLLINRTKTDNHWIGITLLDQNNTATGAKITLNTTDVTQTKYTYSVSSYLSQSTSRVHFGFPTTDEIKNIKIRWPNGEEQLFNNVKSDQYITITKNNNQISNTNIPDKSKNVPDKKSTIFEGANKILFIETLSLANGSLTASKQLLLAINDNNFEIRIKALDGLRAINSPMLLSALYDSMFDSEKLVRIHAIKALKLLELDRSVPWLINALSDLDVDVICHAANTFEQFFIEEEAVVIKKHLAVPYLINLLNNDNPAIQICAANALAESDSYRGTAPLTKLIESPNTDVKISAVRALGELRFGSAVISLTRLVLSSNQPTKVKASSLIALQKLDNKIIQNLFTTLFDLPSSKQDIRSGIDIIDSLKSNTESLTLNWKALHSYRQKLVRKSCINNDKLYCLKNSMPKPLANNDPVSIKKHNTALSLKGTIDTVTNIELDIDTRKAELDYLIKDKNSYAKALVVNNITNINDPMYHYFIENLIKFKYNNKTRDTLWGILNNKENSRKTRITVAKALISDEPEKVINTLLNLDKES